MQMKRACDARLHQVPGMVATGASFLEGNLGRDCGVAARPPVQLQLRELRDLIPGTPQANAQNWLKLVGLDFGRKIHSQESVDHCFMNRDLPLWHFSWNIFRYIGDYLHDFAIIFLLCYVCYRRSVAGLSFRTQCIYLTLYMSRYLDLFDHAQHAYLVFHKIYFICATVLALLSFLCFRETYQKDADTCPALTFAILALFIAPWSAADDALMEILWTWSQTLEGFAMVPQYVCSYRNTVSGEASMLVVSFEGCEK
eukprot:Skav227758  [mRNA]  locus=scaffold1653:96616:100159:- [translate_table: standard]